MYPIQFFIMFHSESALRLQQQQQQQQQWKSLRSTAETCCALTLLLVYWK
jgi:hypothetical protein